MFRNRSWLSDNNCPGDRHRNRAIQARPRMEPRTREDGRHSTRSRWRRAGLLAPVVTSLVAAAVVLSVVLVWEVDSRAGVWLVVSAVSNKKTRLLKEWRNRFFVFNFLLFVFITRGHMKMYLMAARPCICIFRRAKEAANVRWLHVT